FWVAVAGQCDEQRPHSVQLNMSSTCFHVNWSMCEVPNLDAFSKSCFESCPLGSSLAKKIFGLAVIMWKCFEGDSRFKKTSTIRPLSHHATLLACKAKIGPTFARPRPTMAENGCHRDSRTISMSFG